jgi:general secretion pathway protein K
VPADIRRPGDGGEAGSITILALWTVVIVGLLLAAAMFTTRSQLRSTHNALAEARARLAAEAGTQLGLARLLRRSAAGSRLFDGTPEPWQDGSTAVDIAIVDEAGKIDLNEAPQELITGLLVAIGQPPEQALLLACNILDRRGQAGVSCPEPAEPAQRRRGQRFAVPEELAQVPGFDAALYDAAADFVTVVSRASAVDPRVAARPVLLALPGATAGLVDAFIESRARWHDIADAAGGLGLAQALPFVTMSPMREFTVTAVAGAASAARYRADLLVRLTGLPARPFQILASRAPPPDRGRRASPPPRRVP